MTTTTTTMSAQRSRGHRPPWEEKPTPAGSASKGVTIPTLLITGTSDPDLARQADRLGVMTVLEKPMSHHELLRFISFSVG